MKISNYFISLSILVLFFISSCKKEALTGHDEQQSSLTKEELKEGRELLLNHGFKEQSTTAGNVKNRSNTAIKHLSSLKELKSLPTINGLWDPIFGPVEDEDYYVGSPISLGIYTRHFLKLQQLGLPSVFTYSVLNDNGQKSIVTSNLDMDPGSIATGSYYGYINVGGTIISSNVQITGMLSEAYQYGDQAYTRDYMVDFNDNGGAATIKLSIF